MPIDQTGTAPGIVSQPEEQPKLNMRCKADGCDSMQVTEMRIPGHTGATRLYKCCKCPKVSAITVGGSFEL
jgi:hypothetical protein